MNFYEIQLSDAQMRLLERYAKSLGLTPEDALSQAASAHLERCYRLPVLPATVVPIRAFQSDRKSE